jgi:acyl-CoA reductase-like NAD-dependent aldehyde dehydrogenase
VKQSLLSYDTKGDMPKLTVKPASDRLYNELLATAFDGRGRNARYRQSQLFFLQNRLKTDLQKLRTAIKQDTSSADENIEAELAMSLDGIRRLYQDIDFEQSIQEEFRITRKKDNTERRIPYGVVVLKPTLHTRYFSIISALAAAFAAGNVVLLEIRGWSLGSSAFACEYVVAGLICSKSSWSLACVRLTNIFGRSSKYSTMPLASLPRPG